MVQCPKEEGTPKGAENDHVHYQMPNSLCSVGGGVNWGVD